MARTWWLFGLGSALVASGAAPGCAPEPFTYEPEASSSGAGGGAGGGGLACEPQSMASCYSGPKDTLMIGICKEGVATCLADGTGYGVCEGQVVPAFDDCSTPLDEDCNSSSPTCTGAHVWSLRWGDAMGQRAWSVAVDLEGNSLVAGEFAGDLGVGGLVSQGGSDVFVVKLNPAGNVLWARGWGDAMNQLAYGVAVDDATGDVFVTGMFEGVVNFGTGALTSSGTDVFVVKLSAAGEVLWSKRFGDAGDQRAYDIAAAGESVALTGTFEGVLDFGAAGIIMSGGTYDGFVAVLDSATGAGVWCKGFGDAASQTGWRVRTGAGGSVFMTGNGSGAVNFGDGPKPNVGGTDSYLVKLGANGGVVWSKSLGSAGDEQGLGLAVDGAGDVVIAGTTTGVIDFGGGALTPVGTTDMYLAKYTNEGTFVWADLFGTDTAQPNGVATDGANHILVTGTVSGAIDFGAGVLPGHMDADAFIAKFNGAGAALWAMNVGAMGGTERGSDVAANSLGEVVFSGSFNNMIVFPAAPVLSSVGGFDAFIAKLAP